MFTNRKYVGNWDLVREEEQAAEVMIKLKKKGETLYQSRQSGVAVLV
jgi:hypothetical protein